MIRAGVPEKVAMQISGHKTASMLWRYNITDTRDVKEAGKRTERYLEAKKEEDQHADKHAEYFSTDVRQVVPGAGLEPALRLREKGF